MASDFSKPLVSDAYATLLQTLVTELQDLARGLEPTATGTHTNIPTNTIRWNATNNYWEKFNGTSWAALAAPYAISISGTAANIAGAGIVAVANGGSGVGTLTGVVYGNGTAAHTAATAAQIVAAIGATAVTNATNATTAATANALNAANAYSAVNMTLSGAILSMNSAGSNSQIPMYSASLLRGYVHADSSGIGFLSSAGGWAFQIPYGTANATVTGSFTATQFNGSGAGLTGTAGSLTSGACSGNAATATTIAGTSGSAPVFGARAWCSWNGATVGTNAPLAGGNVTSVTRNAAGDYTINFTTAMPHANYAVACISPNGNGRWLSLYMGTSPTTDTTAVGAKTTTSVRVNWGQSLLDGNNFSIVVIC